MVRSAPMPLKLRHLFIRLARNVCVECEVLVYTYKCGVGVFLVCDDKLQAWHMASVHLFIGVRFALGTLLHARRGDECGLSSKAVSRKGRDLLSACRWQSL